MNARLGRWRVRMQVLVNSMVGEGGWMDDERILCAGWIYFGEHQRIVFRVMMVLQICIAPRLYRWRAYAMRRHHIKGADGRTVKRLMGAALRRLSGTNDRLNPSPLFAFLSFSSDFTPLIQSLSIYFLSFFLFFLLLWCMYLVLVHSALPDLVAIFTHPRLFRSSLFRCAPFSIYLGKTYPPAIRFASVGSLQQMRIITTASACVSRAEKRKSRCTPPSSSETQRSRSDLAAQLVVLTLDQQVLK
ncbi:hypothetical protein J3F83DRAFT_300430 [Trichoderma novae-zelandiae]